MAETQTRPEKSQQDFDDKFNSMTSPENWNKSAKDPQQKRGGKGINLAKSAGNAIKKGRKVKQQVGKAKQAVQHGKQVAKQAVKKGAKKLAVKALAAVPVVGTAAAAAVTVIGTHWKKILYIGIGLVLLVALLSSDSGGNDNGGQNTLQQEGRLQLQQANAPVSSISCFPAQLLLDQTTTCTIQVTYAGSADDVKIVDYILQGSSFVSSPNGTHNPGESITWDAKDLGLQLNPINITVSFVIKSTQMDWIVYNTYFITPINPSASGTTSNVPPTQDTCNGTYTLMDSLGKVKNPFGNFGDPQCNFSKQLVGDQLNKLDSTPTDALKWDKLIKCESGYNPNAYNPNSTSGKGAFGLFQMNPNGTGSDNGSVNWPQQVTNAVTHLQGDGGNFQGYWGCARTQGL